MVQLFGIVRYQGRFAMVIYYNPDDDLYNLLTPENEELIVEPEELEVWPIREVQNEISVDELEGLMNSLLLRRDS